jgi:hypothetical protein
MTYWGTESHGYISWGNGARLERFAAVQPLDGFSWEAPERRDSGAREELLTRVTHQLTTTAGLTLTDGQVRRLLGFDGELCGRVIDELSARGILRHTNESTYEVVRSTAA